jgi:ribosome biogenesis GTPase A
VCKIVITELRSGKLGPITLETPGTIEAELAELKITLAEKAAKKEARDRKRKAKFKARNKMP